MQPVTKYSAISDCNAFLYLCRTFMSWQYKVSGVTDCQVYESKVRLMETETPFYARRVKGPTY